MNKNDVIQLLRTIKDKVYVGVTKFEVIDFTTHEGLLERTEVGNFSLTAKGQDLLNGKISLDGLTTS
jgi:hypothetical protein